MCYRLEGRNSADIQNRTGEAFTLANVLSTYEDYGRLHNYYNSVEIVWFFKNSINLPNVRCNSQINGDILLKRELKNIIIYKLRER